MINAWSWTNLPITCQETRVFNCSESGNDCRYSNKEKLDNKRHCINGVASSHHIPPKQGTKLNIENLFTYKTRQLFGSFFSPKVFIPPKCSVVSSIQVPAHHCYRAECQLVWPHGPRGEWTRRWDCDHCSKELPTPQQPRKKTKDTNNINNHKKKDKKNNNNHNVTWWLKMVFV